VQPINVVLADPTGILSDIILETLERACDISVAVAGAGDSAVSLAGETKADVAILRGDAEWLVAVGRELLRLRPRMNVLTIHGDGRETFLHRPLGEISPQELLEAVREAAPEAR
jgi:DNA-binding NarL/FixJ family response regulator